MVCMYLLAYFVIRWYSVDLASGQWYSYPRYRLEMNAIAAAVVGGASMSGGVGYIGGTVVGAILIATIRNGGTLWSLNGQIIEILIGCLIIAAVLMDKLKKTK